MNLKINLKMKNKSFALLITALMLTSVIAILMPVQAQEGVHGGSPTTPARADHFQAVSNQA
jgi:hypothetical protein